MKKSVRGRALQTMPRQIEPFLQVQNQEPRYARRTVLKTLGMSGLGLLCGKSAAASLLLPPPESLLPFEELSPSSSGISWIHENGGSGEMYLPETVGSGCAFLDYDNDGWMDLYFVNSGPCDFYTPPKPLRNALYRNNRDGTFTDVTVAAGVPGNAYGMGVAVGDYDGDGLPDLFVTQYPNSILYHNNGDGTFTDVTAKAGLACPGWASSAVWFDYDNDGRLDLFVCRFVDFSKSKNPYCGFGPDKIRAYCRPALFTPEPCWLFHNNGNGSFTDVSKESGIGKSLGKAWGVVAADINNDGWMDLFVGNDMVPNFLFVNQGKGRFQENAGLAGVGYSAFGTARSGMGVDAADYDQDGLIDLFVANIDHESFSLYRNRGDESFLDSSNKTGIASATWLLSGWGMKFFDYDNDGNLDLFLANGHPDLMVEHQLQGVNYLESLLLFHNTGTNFKNVSLESGPAFSKKLAARGLALGDFNNDGAVDVLVSQNNGAPVLLQNKVGGKNHWLGVRLVGTSSNIDAIGARLTYKAGDLQRHVFKVGGGSYLSSHDPRVVLGLGSNAKLDWLEIKWPKPSPRVERFTDLPVDCYITIVEGQGKWK
jgi:enediyne biosynthesis protein E4